MLSRGLYHPNFPVVLVYRKRHTHSRARPGSLLGWSRPWPVLDGPSSFRASVFRAPFFRSFYLALAVYPFCSNKLRQVRFVKLIIER